MQVSWNYFLSHDFSSLCIVATVIAMELKISHYIYRMRIFLSGIWGTSMYPDEEGDMSGNVMLDQNVNKI